MRGRSGEGSLSASGTGLVAGRRMPGLDGFWVFVAGDLLIFTLLFVSFLDARSDDIGGFDAARHLLDPTHGGINTLLLLTSSWLVALASSAREDCRRARRLLAPGIVLGLGFVALKVYEYAHVLGLDPTQDQQPFLAYYFGITGLHLAHVMIGCILLTVMWVRLPTLSAESRGFESVTCFWHLVDLLWLVIFPLLYLLRAAT